ncbi:carbohydrate ABC transporter permease [Dactylosporangium sucinum]|uniref:Sugar ABC transporter ATP-binding protein n=1 Tax=Dactylosporangium sucinum TaxID=1424081 RepID=A0A917SZ88_9ACTN|nr:carbohydrate ABC transporter permease [Dactylosporangium sucinum]GGM03187.1 sugar ABC transporter ATP-binding protein [Dactylosporangium sucinum]
MTTSETTAPAAVPARVQDALRVLRHVVRYAAWAVLAVAAAATVLPFIWMVGVSLRTPADLYADPARLWPGQWSLAGFHAVLTQLPFARLVLNTFVFAGGTTVLLVFLDSLAGYALARLRFRGRQAIFLVILATLMVPFQITIIPVFLTLFDLGWLNTFEGLIIPRATSALGIFMLRQFFRTLPRELDDAAHIDGANSFQVYWRIILPLARPALVSLFVIQFMALWNDFLWPLVVSSTIDMRTLPSALTLFSSQSGVDHAALMAGAAISLAPLAVAFLLAQRFFVQGIATTGLK